jgi:hypothetical protein
MRLQLLVIGFGALVGCADQGVPLCFGIQERPDLNPIEQIVFSNAVARTDQECTSPNRQCRISLRRDHEGRFLVTVVYATAQRDGTCIFLPGDDEIHVYAANGSYLERYPGM